MQDQEQTEFYYDAFISYRHSPLDKFVAEQLHKRLETFRMPKSMQKQMKSGQPQPRRVFRDRDELPLASNLADPITEALEQSGFLVVVCTPRLPQSLWCKKEIETFIAMHGRERVLAVLAEGEPEESFPEELLYVYEEQTDADGTVHRIKKPIEPLAADVRGKDRREIKKKMRTELLRLLAAMCGCSFDDLRQRHRERRLRRIVTAVTAAAAVCLGFGAVSTTMALRIHGQNREITAQNEQIESQSAEITRQYQDSLRSQAVMTSKEAFRLLEEGDRFGAVALAESVLPEQQDDLTLPYTPQAQYALTESLYLYENDESIRPVRRLENDAAVQHVQISPEGGRALVLDDVGNLTLWNLESGEAEQKLLMDGVYSAANNMVFLSEELFACPVEEGIGVYSASDGKEVAVYRLDDVYGSVAAYAQDGRLFVETEKMAGLYDVTRTQPLWTYDCREGTRLQGCAGFDAAGEYAAVGLEIAAADETADDTYEVQIVSMRDGGGVCGFALEERPELLYFDGGKLYVAANSRLNMGSGSLLENYGYGTLACYDPQSGALQWKMTENAWIYDCHTVGAPGEERLACQTYDKVDILSPTDGTVLHTVETGCQITALIPAEGTDTAVLFTRDGKYIYLNVQSGTAFYNENKFASVSDNVQGFYQGKGSFLLQSYKDNGLVQYAWVKDPKLTKCLRTDGSIFDVCPDAQGARIAMVVYRDNGPSVQMFDAATGGLLWEEELEELPEILCFYGEKQERLAVVASGQGRQYDAASGSLLKSEEMEDYFDIQGTDRQKQYALAKNSEALCKISLSDMEQTDITPGAWQLQAATAWSVSPGMTYAAAAFDQEAGVRLHHLINDTSVGTIPVNTSYLSGLYFNGDDTLLYIVYRDGKVEAYRTDNMALASEYSELENEVIKVEQAGSGTLLISDLDTWLLNETGDIIASLAGYAGMMPDGSAFLLKGRQTLYRVPAYSYEQILQQADALQSQKTLY